MYGAGRQEIQALWRMCTRSFNLRGTEVMNALVTFKTILLIMH